MGGISETRRRLLKQAARQVTTAEGRLEDARATLHREAREANREGGSGAQIAQVLAEAGREVSRQRVYQMIEK